MSMNSRKKLFQCVIVTLLLMSSFELLASREKFALEKYDIGQLKVSMIVKRNGGKDRYAYVRDPENFMHHVEIGEPIGNRDGRIIFIDQCQLVVVELFSDSKGGWVEKKRSLLSLEEKCEVKPKKGSFN